MMDYHKKFIALDLETTHLDMREGRIMEVGAVEAELYFDEKKSAVAVKLGNTFSLLVNPQTPPSPEALMLTGISAAELAAAPQWREVKTKLQKFLGKAVILGHNVGFDLMYLKNQKLNLKNDFQDTLEIAQTLLPLFPAHSLEFLSQEFRVLDKVSHRALADSESSALILAGILNEFLSFPLRLQTEIRALLQDSAASFADLILDLPAVTRRTRSLQKNSPAAEASADLPPTLEKLAKDLPKQTLAALPLNFAHRQQLLSYLGAHSQGLLVGVSQSMHLDAVPLRLRIADPAWALCEIRLNAVKNGAPKSAVSRKFFIKIAIFQTFLGGFDLSAVKWTMEERGLLPALLADPSICSGHKCGYFRSLQSGSETKFADLRTIFTLLREWPADFSQRHLVLFDLGRIEDEFADNVTRKINLREIRSMVSVFYPIQFPTLSREEETPREVETFMNELDLFFGIMHLVFLQKGGEFSQSILIDDLERESDRWRKLTHPAGKFLEKFASLLTYLRNQLDLATDEQALELQALLRKLNRMSSFLQEFFGVPQAAKYYWLKFSADWTDLMAAPGDLRGEWQAVFEKLNGLTILDTALPALAWNYFQNRLGLANFKRLPVVFSEEALTVPVQIFKKSLSGDELAGFLRGLPRSTIVVLPNEAKLRETYEALQSRPGNQDVLAYRWSGNISALKGKLKRAKTFLLLLTTNAVLKYFPVMPYACNLVILRLPFEAPGTKPGAPRAFSQNAFAEYILPRAVHLLHTIFSRFFASGDAPAAVYLLDPRVLTDYNQAFLRYLEEMPNFDISTR